MTRLSNLDRLLLVVIALLLSVIAAQGAGGRLAAPAAAGDSAVVPASLPPAPAGTPGGPVAAIPVDDQGRFVVIDGAGRRMMFCEIVWTGPDASLVVRKITDY